MLLVFGEHILSFLSWPLIPIKNLSNKEVMLQLQHLGCRNPTKQEVYTNLIIFADIAAKGLSALNIINDYILYRYELPTGPRSAVRP